MVLDLRLKTGFADRFDAGRRPVGMAVAGDDPDPFEAAEHVELGDDQAVERR